MAACDVREKQSMTKATSQESLDGEAARRRRRGGGRPSTARPTRYHREHAACAVPAADSPFRDGPLTGLDDVEWVTLAWIDWYNQRRLHHRLGPIPPAEYETQHYAQFTALQLEQSLT